MADFYELQECTTKAVNINNYSWLHQRDIRERREGRWQTRMPEQLGIETARLARIIEGKIRRMKDPMVEQMRGALKSSS